jgi:GAG-pre-integrase domain
MKLSGSKDGKIGSIEAHVDPIDNLPTTLMYVLDKTNQAVKDFANKTTTVSEANHNLSDPEKELLKWNQRLGHIDFCKVKFLFCTGILAYSDVSRQLHTAASKILNPPKCAACQFGKQCQRSVPTTAEEKVSDKIGAIARDSKLPGEHAKLKVDYSLPRDRLRIL